MTPIDLNFLRSGAIKKTKKNSVIKKVRYLTQQIGSELVTIELDPPRNLKITNSVKRRKK